MTPDVRDIWRIPGKLVLTPTDLTTTFPYGGTALGVTSMHALEIRREYDQVEAQEWGGAVSKVAYLGEKPIFYGILRSWDPDLMALLFPQGGAGSRSGSATPGNRYVLGNPSTGTPRPGTLVAGNLIAFCPLAPDQMPFLVMLNAKPRLDIQARMEMALSREIAFPFAFELSPNSNGKTFCWGLHDDPELVLS